MRLFRVFAAVTPLLLGLPTVALAEDGGGGDCQSLIPPNCLETLGAGARGIPREAPKECSERFLAYRNCLARSVAAAPPPPPQSGDVGCGPEDARQLWPGLEGSGNIADLETFARFCDGTIQGQLAANRAERLKAGGSGGASSPSASPSLSPSLSPITAPSSSSAGPLKLPDLLGRWDGWHECGGYRGRIVVDLKKIAGGVAQGERYIFPADCPDCNPVGALYLHAMPPRDDGQIELVARQWRVQPPGYPRCILLGNIGDDGRSISGDSVSCDCGAFELRRM
ncbi:MAG: hypothetical protein KTR21_01250 [Rhodobacteraceae bacterium]|nr:hypothetical protein [Paracoccaceae bacterium]